MFKWLIGISDMAQKTSTVQENMIISEVDLRNSKDVDLPFTDKIMALYLSEANCNSLLSISLSSHPHPLCSLHPSVSLFLTFCQLAPQGKESVSVNWTERTGTELVESCWSRAHSFLQPGRKKRPHSCKSNCQPAPLIPCLPNYPSVLFPKGETMNAINKRVL